MNGSGIILRRRIMVFGSYLCRTRPLDFKWSLDLTHQHMVIYGFLLARLETELCTSIHNAVVLWCLSCSSVLGKQLSVCLYLSFIPYSQGLSRCLETLQRSNLKLFALQLSPIIRPGALGLLHLLHADVQIGRTWSISGNRFAWRFHHPDTGDRVRRDGPS